MSINGCLLGLYEKALPEDMGWDDRLKTAKQAGYGFLEISIDETDERMARVGWPKAKVDELIGAIRRQQMPILTMCLSGNRRYPIGSEDEKTRRAGIKLIEDAVDFSVHVGIRIVQLAGYDEYYKPQNARTRALFVEALREVTGYAAARGVSLAFETMETDLMDSIEKSMAYVREIDSPYLQVYPDVGNVTATGNDVLKDFASGEGHIMAIHLKDTVPGVVRDIPYGEGTVDFDAFFAMIKESNFKGLLVAEMWATDDREASIAYIKTAYDFLHEAYRSAGDDRTVISAV